MYYIINKTTREVLRESETPFNVDESVQPSDENLVQLKHVADDVQPDFDPDTQKLERVFTDDDKNFTRTFTYVVVERTQEEKANIAKAKTGLQEKNTRKNALKNNVKDLGKGTNSERIAVLEDLVKMLIKEVNSLDVLN